MVRHERLGAERDKRLMARLPMQRQPSMRIPLHSPLLQRDRAKHREDGENTIAEGVARRLLMAMQLDLHQVNVAIVHATPTMLSRPIDLIHTDVAVMFSLGIHFIVQIHEKHL